jgi:hypothetical protein
MSENGVGKEAAIRTGPPIVKFEELALLQKVATNTPPHTWLYTNFVLLLRESLLHL